MLRQEQLDLAEVIKSHLQTVSASLDGGFIVIGGWAVHAWGKRDYSLDGDAMVSFEALGVLRDEFLVTPNPRMNKQQYQLHGFDVDLYVEQQHKLPVSFDDLSLKAKVKEGMWVACPEHLLALKCAAAKDRSGTPKGDKDKQDIVLLVGLIRESDFDCEVLNKYIEAPEATVILEALNDKELFLGLANGNSFEAKALRGKALKSWEDIYELCKLQQEGPGI